MMEYKCPCDGCVCVPVCRHKTYCDLTGDCRLIENYIVYYNSSANSSLKFDASHGFPHRVGIQEALKPTVWAVNFDGLFTGEIS